MTTRKDFEDIAGTEAKPDLYSNVAEAVGIDRETAKKATLAAAYNALPELVYHIYLEGVQKADLAYVLKKDTQYKASWKRRGGPGAFFTIARPWDRLENMLATWVDGSGAYDLFGMLNYEGLDGPDGSLIACIRDLRRYLLLLEAEAVHREMLKRNGARTENAFHRVVADIVGATGGGYAAAGPMKGGGGSNTPNIQGSTQSSHSGVGGAANKRQATEIDRMLKQLPDRNLDDGVREISSGYPAEWYMDISVANSPALYIVNRNNPRFRESPYLIEHLLRLELEQNHKEWTLLPDWYHNLYEWDGSQTKWRVKPQYREMWCGLPH